jgi:hypothetical protein
MTVTYPIVEWIQQSLLIDPSGHRHQKNPTFGYIQNVNTSPGGQLDFGAINTAFSGSISDTKLVYARPSTLGSASGIFNMKFFLVSISAWTVGSYRFLERKLLHFANGLTLTQANSDTPTTVPANSNIVGTIAPFFVTGQPTISGVNDQGVTEYVYLAVFADTNVPPSQYGGPGQGSFRYRLLYDFS